MKFEEMEEKMRRQKEKGAHDDSATIEDVNDEEMRVVTEIIDVTTMMVPDEAEPVELSAPEQQVPLLSKSVEAERVHLIEIKTDGISGHLQRNPSGAEFTWPRKILIVCVISSRVGNRVVIYELKKLK